MAPNTEKIDQGQTEEQLDLGKLAREVGANYLVYPDVKYPPLEPFEHKDPGHLADPKKASLFNHADKIYDLTPHVGTVIEGLQLSTLTDQQKNDLALLAADRGVVFFKKQELNPYQAVEFGRYFGRLHTHNYAGHPPGLPEIVSILYDEKNPATVAAIESKRTSDGIHTDISYEKQPAGLSILKIDLLPSTGGDTIWWSGYSAYDRLSPAMQKFVEGLSAVHTGDYHKRLAKLSGRTIRREFPPDTIHPVVRTHPVTGWKSLFVQPVFTKSIVGMTKHESDAILNFLYNHIAGGYDFSVRFKWEEGSVAIWDNRCTLHAAIFDYFDQGRRHGYRVTPTAEVPFYDPNSKSKKQAEQEAPEKVSSRHDQ
ncbi:uncharacterized protein BX664DRAFT_324940 [Halteromyces radiatus]|uniref:uncharacterized protein n=1 Tax=Halteromyces radiatus TaxID=101107 RepID=UPI00221F6B5B|nr:uncharacterized protein BX664DRAFT_324940 [Halteromyces radiatus]KAI8096814.1 hypothetical protein BX664DRAFT_324940 [Halteromyces radiatus]